jgi:Fe-S-cluster containining protein
MADDDRKPDIGAMNPEPLRRDVNDSLKFVHTMAMQSKSDLVEAQASLYALVEELVARGVVDVHSLEERRTRSKAREAQRAIESAHVKVSENVDKYQLTNLPQIDCDARLPLCRGRCCKFHFALSFQDLDEQIVKWDYANPYGIRHREDGYCVHNDAATLGCGVYSNRPAVCRTYDCSKDPRIWIDFDKRIPAPE